MALISERYTTPRWPKKNILMLIQPPFLELLELLELPLQLSELPLKLLEPPRATMVATQWEKCQAFKDGKTSTVFLDKKPLDGRPTKFKHIPYQKNDKKSEKNET